MGESVATTQCVITCRNSQGMALTANLLRIKRYSVVFELYNPYSILQLSEVLSEFRIMAARRVVFDGKAVVSSLLHTGIVLVCEVALDEGWVEVDFLSNLGGRGDLGTQFQEFMAEWKSGHRVQDPFKLNVADMSGTLSGIQQWMTSVDAGIRSTITRRRDDLEREVFDGVEQRIFEEVLPTMEKFERIARQIPPEEAAVHKSYVRRELHPLVLCSPFLHRTFTKPLGYAGDYEMVNMMLRSPYEGSSTFAKIINAALLHTEPVVAHRNRIDYLLELLREETRKRSQKGHTRIFNLACGPAVEIGRFLAECEESELAEVDLLDFNAETLTDTEERLRQQRQKSGRETPLRFYQRSVHQLLKAAAQGGDAEFAGYDVVYCAGLFDYLSQRVCCRLVELFCTMAKPGGKVVVTNVASSNPRIAWMEYLMEWNLIYRDEREMFDLVPHSLPIQGSRVLADATGVNLFLEIDLPG